MQYCAAVQMSIELGLFPTDLVCPARLRRRANRAFGVATAGGEGKERGGAVLRNSQHELARRPRRPGSPNAPRGPSPRQPAHPSSALKYKPANGQRESLSSELDADLLPTSIQERQDLRRWPLTRTLV